MIASFAASLLAVLAPAPTIAQTPEFVPLTVGETITLNALDVERQINVILPPEYHLEPDRTWPVVYMLDGARSQDLLLGAGISSWNSLWGRSQSVIWVGIETKDRQRELLAPTRDDEEIARYPTAGQGAVFRDWVINEVKPLIASRYRTDGDAYLVGESAAGHFVLETWLENPAAFSGYAAISPSLQWDFEALSLRIEAAPDQRLPLYLSLADEGGALEKGVLRVVDSLEPSQRWCFSDRRTDLKHANSLHGLLPEALQFLLPTEADWLEDFGLTLRCDMQGGLAE